MIYELRTYDFAPGTASRYLELFATRGLPLITRHLPLLGYWLPETGGPNRLYHLWAYDDLADRAQRRAALWADGEWTQDFALEAFPLVARQESRIMGLAIGTNRLAGVESAAKQPLPAVSATPLLAPTWTVICFAVDPGPPQDEVLVARFRVLSGERPGTSVTLTRFDDPRDIPLPGYPALAHGILKPAAFSPLQ